MASRSTRRWARRCLHVPWKYGFKSIKSIVKFTFTDERPVNFWQAARIERIRLLGERQSGGAAPALEPGERARHHHQRQHSDAHLQRLWRVCRRSLQEWTASRSHGAGWRSSRRVGGLHRESGLQTRFRKMPANCAVDGGRGVLGASGSPGRRRLPPGAIASECRPYVFPQTAGGESSRERWTPRGPAVLCRASGMTSGIHLQRGTADSDHSRAGEEMTHESSDRRDKSMISFGKDATNEV